MKTSQIKKLPFVLRSICIGTLICNTLVSQAQIITTIAGNGIPSYAGDGGQATAAAINHPIHTAMDASGNLYFSDYYNSRIRKINSSGIITTFAGNGINGFSGDGLPATSASLSTPTGIAFGLSGSLYISDYSNSRVRKVSPTGIISTIAGTGITGYSGDGGPASAARITESWGIVEDASGNIFFSDRLNNVIRKINTSGIITTVAGTGVAGYSGDGGPASAAKLNHPIDLCFDVAGNLYFPDFFNNCIRKITPSGVISTIAGTGISGFSGDGGPATAAQFNNPVGISIDTAGNILVGDYFNNRIRRITSTGIISTVAGTGLAGFSGDGGPATSAQINVPQGVSIYSGGRVFICDVNNSRIRLFTLYTLSNTPPYFINGHNQTLSVCVSETPAPVNLNTILSASDTNAGQTETWSVVSAPTHGVLYASYTTTSTGGIITPSGLTYTPNPGYSGPDLFKVRVSDGVAADTTTVNITINPLPNAGVISGVDSICPGEHTALTESVTGGIWSNSNISVSTINGGGSVSGLAPGRDTIIYTVMNSCGIVTAIFPFYVRSYTACHTGFGKIIEVGEPNITIYPNPTKGSFFVALSSGINEPVKFTLTTVTGQNLYNFASVTNHEVEISRELEPGLYLIEATSSQGKYQSKMLVIK